MRHFEEELDNLRKSLLEMCGLVEAAIYRSVLALTRGDSNQAAQVMESESRINQFQIAIDDTAIRLLALDQPVAKDLRFIAAAIKINGDLERMGDEAVNIAERSVLLMRDLPANPPVDIPQMAALTEGMVRKAIDSFVKKDADMARGVLVSDDVVDELWHTTFDQLVDYTRDHPAVAKQCIHLIFIAHNLERIADHATNIAEDVIYLVEGLDVRHHSEATP